VNRTEKTGQEARSKKRNGGKAGEKVATNRLVKNLLREKKELKGKR